MRSDLLQLQEANNTLFVFDFDGVLSEAKFAKDCLSISTNEEELLSKEINNKQSDYVPVPITTEFARKCKKKVVLSYVHNSLESGRKQEFLEKNFGMKSDAFIGVHSYEQKLAALKILSEKYVGYTVVYIDDYLDFLFTVEEHFKGCNHKIKAYHVSSLFV